MVTFYKIMTRCLRAAQKLLGASTIGVRVLVINSQQQVLLLRHTYMPGWHLPGGGVDSGEPAELAAIRELREETALIATNPPEICGIYYNQVMGVNDYVVLYRVHAFEQSNLPISPEIAEVNWFSLTNLPPDTVKSVHLRLGEFLYNQPKMHQW